MYENQNIAESLKQYWQLTTRFAYQHVKRCETTGSYGAFIRSVNGTLGRRPARRYSQSAVSTNEISKSDVLSTFKTEKNIYKLR